MRLLIIGGTKFLGRATAEAALARGHELTLFNRGQTNAELFPDVEQLHGDRKRDLSLLAGRSWDAVIDPSGYIPADVRASAEQLRDAGRYVFISSVSVYADFSTGPTESSPTAELGSLPVDELAPDSSNYGPLKALAEEEVKRGLRRARADRPARLDRRPARPDRPLHLLGAAARPRRRDPRAGTARAARPVHRRPRPGRVDRATASSRASPGRSTRRTRASRGASCWRAPTPTWVSDEFLQEHEVGPWMELPLWLPDPEWAGMHATDIRRAVEAGLRFRPLEETIAGAADAPAEDGVGLTAEREAELLAAWHSR